MSHPTRVRGLKRHRPRDEDGDDDVAPYTGAWIETRSSMSPTTRYGVAPYTGAWIETNAVGEVVGAVVSHPTRVRGLKLKNGLVGYNVSTSRTLHGCVD